MDKVGGLNPSEKYQSIEMMTFPTEQKNKVHVPNHQPEKKKNTDAGDGSQISDNLFRGF